MRIKSSKAFRDAVNPQQETPVPKAKLRAQLKRPLDDEDAQALAQADAASAQALASDNAPVLDAQAETGVVSDAGGTADTSTSSAASPASEDTVAAAFLFLGVLGVAAVAGRGGSSAPAPADTTRPTDTTRPVITSAAIVSVAENTPATTVVHKVVATDNVAVTAYALPGGADNSKFTIDATTGDIRFKVAPDFEAPASAAGSNTYSLKVRATDAAGNSTTQDITINVTDVKDTAPTFTSATTAWVLENIAASAVVYDAQATDNGGAADVGIIYSKSGADAALFTLDAATGQLKFIASPNFEAPLDAGANNVYDVTLTATNAAHNTSSQAVALTIVNDEAPTSAGAFALWQIAETPDTEGDINILNVNSAEIMQQRDTTNATGTANGTNALTQYINQVTGTDIVSRAEYAAGFSISGHAAAGASATIKFNLDNDRTDGVNQIGTPLEDGVNGVHIAYSNTTGDYTITFDANSAALLPATHNTYGSGIHQLTVDTSGNGEKDGTGATLEASRLFLVADGTASSADTGTVAQNYSVQDRVTNDVFVYYYGDPDGAGVGLWTLLDNGDSASNPGTVTTDQDGNTTAARSGDQDYYNNPTDNTNAAPVTASNTALHLVTNIAAQTWEFHMATQTSFVEWATADAQATDHISFGSNTSRQASLAEAIALYAANFGQGRTSVLVEDPRSHVVGVVEAMSNAVSIDRFTFQSANTPGGWDNSMWSAAPTPSGHALLTLEVGCLYDSPGSNLSVTAVL